MYLKKRKTPKDGNYTIVISARNKIKQLVREVGGLSPYEKHIEALLKIGRDKKALKLAKKRLGNIKRAKKKKRTNKSFSKNQKEFLSFNLVKFNQSFFYIKISYKHLKLKLK